MIYQKSELPPLEYSLSKIKKNDFNNVNCISIGIGMMEKLVQ